MFLIEKWVYSYKNKNSTNFKPLSQFLSLVFTKSKKINKFTTLFKYFALLVNKKKKDLI